jgi:hypothetical protein
LRKEIIGRTPSASVALIGRAKATFSASER